MRTRRLAVGAAGLLGCLALSGCGGGTHEVLLASQGNAGTVTLTYQLDGHKPITVTSQPAASGTDAVATASVVLTMKTGTHVHVSGAATSPSASILSCTIAVDSVVKQAHLATAAADSTNNKPLDCAADSYVSHRPYGLNHFFEVLAFAVSLLIVVAALGSLVVSRRRG